VALHGKTFNAQFFDTVRMPSKKAVGAVNDGRKVITDALASGGLMIGATHTARIERAFDHLTGYLKTAAVDGKVPLSDAAIDKLFASKFAGAAGRAARDMISAGGFCPKTPKARRSREGIRAARGHRSPHRLRHHRDAAKCHRAAGLELPR
jgi:alkylation response protein AidB-like acyl-CoA dehydrogenase